MVRLEWAHVVAFDGPEREPLAVFKASTRAGLQPYISLLELRYPVDRKRVRAKPKPIFVAVHRVDSSVYYRRLGPEEFRLLIGLRDGLTLSKAIDSAIKTTSNEELETWFATWARYGWLTIR